MLLVYTFRHYCGFHDITTCPPGDPTVIGKDPPGVTGRELTVEGFGDVPGLPGLAGVATPPRPPPPPPPP
jgi:hypothetical protein